MTDIEKKRKRLFTAALLLSIGFPAGILGIIFGAVEGITVLLVAGIILTVAGFYVMPMLWVQYGETRIYLSLNYAIKRDGLRKISEIAAQLGVNEARAKELIEKSFANRYIEGFKFSEDGTAIEEIISKERAAEELIPAKCASCGATAMVSRADPRCPYCGSVIKIK